MSDERKPEPQAPEAENSELSGKDMEEVVAGAAIVSDPDEGGDVQVVSELTKAERRETWPRSGTSRKVVRPRTERASRRL